jgi:hypothetical protein
MTFSKFLLLLLLHESEPTLQKATANFKLPSDALDATTANVEAGERRDYLYFPTRALIL